MIYNDWYQMYLDLYRRKIAQKTRESYNRLHKLLSPSLGELPIEQIGPDDIQRALLTVEDSAGPRQAQLAYALVHAVFGRACRSRRLTYNPVDGVDKPQHQPRQARAITGPDWEALLPTITEDAAFSLMAYAGLRRGEVLGLRRSDIDLQAGLIHVRRQRVRVSGRMITSAPKSQAGIRDIPIAPQLAPVLAAAVRLLLPNALICPCAPETLARRWRAAQLAAGIAQPYRLHDLRHTYATNLVLLGCNPRILQYIVGHSSYSLTLSTYTHITGTDAAREVSRLAASSH